MITSNSYAIEVRNVSKMYKKYKNSTSKILDLLGFSFRKNYEEFWPLKDINLTIKKGEKVGVIGRNGAGKTTLLSMISDNVKPTKGTIKVDGKVNALFVLGTGFHPEFSGRENIKSSLAFQGITGEEALILEKEIIEFSELEDFIEQPLKTYSAGMYTRLAFTVATAIKPEVLIIDEILGAGDAYFNSKALERMNSLTNSGATVLFVSHDLSSVQKICDRCIWIDKGKIREDGKTLDVIKSYSADVRKREELRLLSQNSGVKINNQDSSNNQLLFRFITSQNSAPQDKAFCVHRIKLFVKNKLLTEINIGDSMDNSLEQDGYIITDKKINWSNSFKKEEKWCREFKNIGGEYIHAIGIFQLPLVIDLKDVSFDIEYFDEFDDEIYFEIYDINKLSYKKLFSFKSQNLKKWNQNNCIYVDSKIEINNHIEFTDDDIESCIEDPVYIKEEIQINNKIDDVFGSKEIKIFSYKLNSETRDKFIFFEGESLKFMIGFEVCEKLYSYPYFGYTLFDLKGNVISNFYEKIEILDIGKYKLVNEMKNSQFLKKNTYYVSFAFYKEIDEYNDSKPWLAYIVLDRKLEFKIENDMQIAINKGMFELNNSLEIIKI